MQNFVPIPNHFPNDCPKEFPKECPSQPLATIQDEPTTVSTASLYRILDANLDRAREGIRVLEEWCRFGLGDPALTACCKDLRQQLGQWHHPQLRAARQTETDPGTALSHPQEQTRADLTAVLQANLGRVQEALRVLEEYGKLYEPNLAAAAKQMRYQVYMLDSQLLPLPPAMRDSIPNSVPDSTSNPTSNSMAVPSSLRQQRLHQLKTAPLYLVTSPHPNLVEVVAAALAGGLTLVQYRDKEANDQTRLALARQLCQLCHEHGALFLVNDRVDIALAVDADGVHLGQQDLPGEVARQLLGPDRLLGRSTTNPEELAGALAEAPDYVGVGPVFETPTKAGKAAAGFEYVRYAKDHVPCPWFAIGGVDAENLGAVLAAGATQVAVVRALMAAPDPKQITQTLLDQLAKAQQLKSNLKAL
jgi:thiamine-phosphate pyrophosphorylase